MTDDYDDLPAPPEIDDGVDFWSGCLLTRIMTDPPTYELTLPGGKVLTLRSGHFFTPPKFTQAFVDATGEFPPLPAGKDAAPFLLDVFRRLLADRKDVEMVEEASDFGTIMADVRLAVAACPQTDDPRDLERGALYLSPEGVWANARCLMARVQHGCPVRFQPADFYRALHKLGMAYLGKKRVDGWQGRAWSVPAGLVPTLRPAERLNGARASATLPLMAGEPENGAAGQ